MPDPVTPSAPTVQQYGSLEYEFGLPEEALTIIPGMAVTELKKGWEPEFMANADGPKGHSPALAKGSNVETFEGSGYLLDEDSFKAVEDFEYDNRLHIVTKKGDAYTHNNFAKCDFSTKSWPGIPPTT